MSDLAEVVAAMNRLLAWADRAEPAPIFASVVRDLGFTPDTPPPGHP